MSKPGVFISLEGGEGAGKTTQAKLLCEALEGAGYETLLTREPGGTKGAEAIRELVLSGRADKWSGMTELLLMYAARVDHVEKFIKPALSRGIWVVCDRFTDSSLAYQGYARGLGVEKVRAVNDAVLGDFAPDVTLLFDIDPVLSQKRVETRGETLTRFDNETLAFHKTLRDAFLEIAAQEKGRIHVVDGAGDCNSIHAHVLHIITQKYPKLAGLLVPGGA